jgi:hypothetical protein
LILLTWPIIHIYFSRESARGCVTNQYTNVRHLKLRSLLKLPVLMTSLLCLMITISNPRFWVLRANAPAYASKTPQFLFALQSNPILRTPAGTIISTFQDLKSQIFCVTNICRPCCLNIADFNCMFKKLFSWHCYGYC